MMMIRDLSQVILFIFRIKPILEQQTKVSKAMEKTVEWSHEDQCYVGTCPGLFLGGCHGDNKDEFYKELCQIVEETLTDMKATMHK